MNSVTVIWSVNAGACLTLAAFYGVVWSKQRANRAYLLFSCSAVAAAVISAFELWMLNATTVEQYQLLMRWIHVPVWVITISCVAFVRLYLHAGRPWLAWSIYALRTLVLILNFTFPVSINFNRITGIRHFPWVGDIISLPLGVPNPWGLLSQISLLLLLGFSIDATITVWRRGDRRRALLVGGSMVLGAILAWHVPMVIWGIIEAPFFLAFTYTGVVAAMGYELSRDMARAAHLTRELDGSTQWVCARGRVQGDEQGKPKRLTGISLDITARKEAELLAQRQRCELGRLRQQKTAFLEREVAERARLEREVIESCAREQRRIAYDLHDGVGQQLVSIALSAKLLEEHLRSDRPAEAEKASAIVRLANEAARHTRLTARSLEGTDGVGDLKAALESLAVNISHSCQVKSVVTPNAALPISAPAAAQLYRIAQEAVRNAVEHGAAREVLIQITFGNREMVLTVQDDGKGFNTKTNGQGMGLRIMRYRAQCIGGSCEVRPGPTQGTLVHCRVPLEAQPSLSTIS